MIGRGLRNAPNKKDCHVIDMVASLGRGIVTTPTLFGLDPREVLKDATSTSMQDMKRRQDEDRQNETAVATTSFRQSGAALTGDISFTHFDNVNDLIENSSGEQHIRGISRLAWVQVDAKRYILSDRSGSFLTIQARENDFTVVVTRKIPFPIAKGKTPYMRPATIATTPTFEHAISAADTFAKKNFVVKMVTTTAAWRRNPASTEQLAFLNRFRKEGNKLMPDSINKGKAADWITKLRHGARGQFKRIQMEKAQVEKQNEKTERETVRVGPLSRKGIFSSLRSMLKQSD
jgi:ATP-dependent helicase IRC3